MFKNRFRYLSPGGYVVSLARVSRVVLLACATTLVLGGCSRKSGCPINDSAQVKTDKAGNYKSAGGSSNLFPKEMRRRGGRN